MDKSYFAKKLGNGRCVVFDFDCTLTYTHYFYFLNMYQLYKDPQKGPWYKEVTENKGFIKSSELDDIASRIENMYGMPKGEYLVNTCMTEEQLINIFFGGSDRLNRLKNMLQTLQDNGYDIYISSRGNCENILSLVRKVGISEYFVEIDAGYPTGDLKCNYNDGKIEFITYILAKTNKYNNIMYVDDDDQEYNIGDPYGDNPKAPIKEHNLNVKYYGLSEIGLKRNDLGLTSDMISKIENDAISRSTYKPEINELAGNMEILNLNESSGIFNPNESSGRMSPVYSMFKTNIVSQLPLRQLQQLQQLQQSPNQTNTTTQGSYMNMNDWFAQNRTGDNVDLDNNSNDKLNDSGDFDLGKSSFIIRNPNINKIDIQGGNLDMNNSNRIEQYYKHKYLKYKQKYLAQKAKLMSRHK